MSPQPGLLTNTVSGMQNTGPSPPPAQATINVLGNPAPVLVLQMLAPNTLQLSLGGQAAEAAIDLRRHGQLGRRSQRLLLQGSDAARRFEAQATQTTHEVALHGHRPIAGDAS